VPKIEVTFDIDANGIVHVQAKDLGTGKEQSIKITASSGLSEEEIQRLVRDAEMHAGDDKKKRELVETRNQADALVYQVEKNLKELGDKIEPPVRADVEEKMEGVKKAMEGEDKDAIDAAVAALTTASHKLAEAIYAASAAKGQPGGPEAGGPGAGPGAGPQQGRKPGEEEVVDADFEEVKK
jgi:molecular chaperone DnaK